MNEYESQFNTQPPSTQLDIITLHDMKTHFLNIAKLDMIKANVEYLVGASFAATGNSTKMIAWFNGQPYHTAPLALNLLHNAIVTAMIGKNHSIQLYNHPLQIIREQSADAQIEDGFILVFGVWASFVSASYISSYIKVNLNI